MSGQESYRYKVGRVPYYELDNGKRNSNIALSKLSDRRRNLAHNFKLRPPSGILGSINPTNPCGVTLPFRSYIENYITVRAGTLEFKPAINIITMAATTKNLQEIEKAKKLNHVPWSEEYEKLISGML